MVFEPVFGYPASFSCCDTTKFLQECFDFQEGLSSDPGALLCCRNIAPMHRPKHSQDRSRCSRSLLSSILPFLPFAMALAHSHNTDASRSTFNDVTGVQLNVSLIQRTFIKFYLSYTESRLIFLLRKSHYYPNIRQTSLRWRRLIRSKQGLLAEYSDSTSRQPLVLD
jgi:hypothetical protein